MHQKLRKKNHVLGLGLGDLLGHLLTAFQGASVSPEQEAYPGSQPSKENSHQSEDERNVPAPGGVCVDGCVHDGQAFSLLGNSISKQTEH